MMRGLDLPDPVLLLGAGASVKSGVPLARDMVALAAKWAYCREHGLDPEDPRVLRSDWWPWLCKQAWFDAQQDPATQYPRAIERLLQPREGRRRFFLNVLHKAQQPSRGYRALAKLAAARAVRHILTVNFDDLPERALRADLKTLYVEMIEGPADLVKFSLASPYAQIVFLHGAVERFEDRNIEEETRELVPAMRDAVLPLLRHHPLVVLGYRGAEPSIMQDLLGRAAREPNAFRYGVFWCLLRGEQPDPAVLELAELIGSNFRFVEVEGFDEAMTGWADGVEPAPAPPLSATEDARVPDLTPADIALADLDQRTLRDRLSEYGTRMGLGLVGESEEDLLGRMESLRLVRSAESGPVVTRAAALLFGAGGQVRVEIQAGESAETFVPIAGNIFTVLSRTLEALDELNEPYRLKGPTSEDVRRFDPRAVKEVVVNALAHRDYDRAEAVRIRLTARELTVVSPGGLVPGLRADRLGEPGERGYRNHVVADLLFGCGAMDKAGSGLADVRRWTRQAGGHAHFGPSESGGNFVVSLTSRDVDPDPVTGTADAGDVEHFVVNAFPVEVSGPIYELPADVRSRHEVYEAQPRAIRAPAFAFDYGKRLLSFTDPATVPGFVALGDGPVREIPLADLLDGDQDERLVVQMLNTVVLDWAFERGLYRDPQGRRLWFPRGDAGPTEVTYRARVREATRTVTRPNISRATGSVRFWEHEAIRFSFRRYGDDWVLHIVPTFVFTTDGYGELLRGPRVGPLATRRMARDFNPQVQNDLYFWRWVLMGEETRAQLCDNVALTSGFIERDVFDMPSALGGLADEEQREEDPADEIAEIAEKAAHEREQLDATESGRAG